MSANFDVEHFDHFLMEVVHLAKFGVEGRSRDARALARKMTARYRTIWPELSQNLAPLTGVTEVLRGARRPLPVDADSRMALARTYDSALAEQPILPYATMARLLQVIAEHKDTNALQKAGLVPIRTVLLVGPPGVGKTMAARWMAAQLSKPLVVLDLASSVSSYLGKTGQNVRQLFDYSKEFECILLLDEVDAIAKRRADDSDLGELKRLVNVLLQELDEWPEGSLLMAATNHPDLLDPAIWRRFELVVELTLPDQEQRHALLSREMAANPSIVDDVVAFTEGMNFSEIRAHLQRARKASLIQQIPEVNAIFSEMSHSVRSLPHAARIALATRLAEKGSLPQREIAEITGVSRTTLQNKKKGKKNEI